MHACGHDAHMAIMVGVARTLVDRIWDISGRYLFVSPGLRFDAGHGAAWYAMLQVPLYQHVNGIQLTAKRNLVTGVQMRF